MLMMRLSCRPFGRVALYTPRYLERIEQGTRRTRRSTLVRLVDVMLVAEPGLGERDELVPA